MSRGHYYISPEGSPPFNMAVDEWLLRRAMVEPESFYLRLYSWSEGCLTLGVHQLAEKALDLSKVGETPVIRRVTGGRALFHDCSELTYALAFNTKRPPTVLLEGSIGQTGGIISDILGEFLKRIGVVTKGVKESSGKFLEAGEFHKSPCLASAARHELLVSGRKIVASAQRRIGDGLLQHGSIKLTPPGLHPALAGVPEAVEQTQSIVGQEFSMLAERFGNSFADSLQIGLDSFEFSEAEMAEIESIARKIKKNPLARRFN